MMQFCKEKCKKIAPYGAVTEEKQGQKGFSYDKMYKFPEYYAIRADSIVQKIGILLIYILDNDNRLIGTLSNTALILAYPTAKLSEVMKTKIVSIDANESHE
ncbi:MAG: hypothetical protein JEY71_16960 [Sphaerochaeta sp.]|nr:hypothetical protein [Sphaerochaeta sp.]